MLAGRWGYLWWLTSSGMNFTSRVKLARRRFLPPLHKLLGDTQRATQVCRIGRGSGYSRSGGRSLKSEMPKHCGLEMPNAGVDVGRYDLLGVSPHH